MKFKEKLPAYLLAASLLCAGGCGPGPDPATKIAAERNRTNIQKIANAYVLCSAFNQNRGPKSKEDLIDFVINKSSIERNLNLMGIERAGFENCFSSEVDHEELTVRWGLRINPNGAPVPLVFEKTGVDGIRRVALSGGRVLEVNDDKKYESLLKGKVDKADAVAGEQEGGQGPPDGE